MVIVSESVPVETCRQVECKACGKRTWMVRVLVLDVLTIAESLQGCGQHIEAVRPVLCHLKDGLTYSASGVARSAGRKQVYL